MKGGIRRQNGSRRKSQRAARDGPGKPEAEQVDAEISDKESELEKAEESLSPKEQELRDAKKFSSSKPKLPRSAMRKLPTLRILDSMAA